MCCSKGIMGEKFISFRFFLMVCIEWNNVCCNLLFFGFNLSLISVCLLVLYSLLIFLIRLDRILGFSFLGIKVCMVKIIYLVI